MRVRYAVANARLGAGVLSFGGAFVIHDAY